MQKTIWLENIEEDALPKLEKDIECDILIIGGGMAGLSTALNLKDEKLDIVLIDKGKIGHGVTSRTTGKLTYMQGNIYSKIETIYNFDIAKKYLQSQVDAIKTVTENIKKYNIDCDFQIVDSYVFENNTNNLNNEKDFLKRASVPFKNHQLPINIRNKNAFYVSHTAVFHPLKYLMSIKNIIKDNIQIYENTIATDIDFKNGRYYVKTENGEITTNKVIVCSHYPFFVIPGLMPIKLHQERSYVVVSESENKAFSAINIDKPTISVRYHNDNLILGGYSHHLSDKLDYKNEEDKLIRFHKNNFKTKILYSWQVHDNMTTDYMPFIGRLNKNYPNLLIATGFNKWGMTNGTIAGKILSDIVLNKNNKYEELFNPSRSINISKILNSIANNFKIGKTYVGTKLVKPKMKGAFITNIDGIRCGVYIDEENKKHIVKNICPHLKCNLVFNRADNTWDCPCHGSRFDIDGNLIEGPSVFSIKLEDTTKKV